MEQIIIKQALMEQRVDQLTREFLDELKETNKLLVTLTDRIQDLEYDRMKAKSFLGGMVFLATAIGGAVVYFLHYFMGIRL